MTNPRIDDAFDDDFIELDGDDDLLEEGKTKPLEKRLKIDALLEEQRLKRLKQALEDGDDFAEFEEELDSDLDELDDDFDDE